MTKSSNPSRARTSDPDAARPSSVLSISAAEEYAYVARDVRRIAIVGGGLVAVLLGLFVASNVFHIGVL